MSAPTPPAHAAASPRHPPSTAAAADTPTDAATGTATLGASCTNREAGLRVAYPEGWRTNTGDGLPACSAFDPVDVSMPEASEIPEAIAIVITHQTVAFERVTDFEADFTTGGPRPARHHRRGPPRHRGRAGGHRRGAP